MGIKNPFKKRNRCGSVLLPDWFCENIESHGYTILSHCPEIIAAVDRIADLIGSMTIHLMENSKSGDIRIQNELSKKIDVNPFSYMTRSSWMHWIVRTLYLEGSGNAIVLPKSRGGLLEELIPVPSVKVSLLQNGDYGYYVSINQKQYDPGELLHFTLNPDPNQPWKGEGYRVPLKAVADNLKQEADTTKDFLKSKWKPSVIIRVDGLTEEFASREGRKKLLKTYADSDVVGEPWLIPAELLDVQQIKPLSLNDLAISNVAELDKKAVASILGVPPFVLGVGEFKREEWNNFINAKIMPIARNIEQELTRKILINPKWYFRFNSRSLYSYDMKDLAEIGENLYVRGIATGNEARDMIGMSPRDGLDELVILENFIPAGMIGDQAKLQKGKSNE